VPETERGLARTAALDRIGPCSPSTNRLGRGRVGDCGFPRQRGDQFHLRAQLQVQVQQHDEADADPDVEDEIDAASDADQLSQLRAVLGNPYEIDPSRCDEYGQERDEGRSRILGPGIQQDRGQQAREGELRDHR
jgi:hypothetical protein